MSDKPRVGKPLKFPSVEELQQKIEAYFNSCFDYQRDMFGNRLHDKEHPDYTKEKPVYLMKQVKPFTVTGLAVFLDTTRETLLDYEGERESSSEEIVKDPAYSYTIKKAKEIIKAYAEESLFSGKQAAGPIFNLKNNWGWKDKSEWEGVLLEKPILGGTSVHRDDSDEEDQGTEEED